jgi:hypothetical protein
MNEFSNLKCLSSSISSISSFQGFNFDEMENIADVDSNIDILCPTGRSSFLEEIELKKTLFQKEFGRPYFQLLTYVPPMYRSTHSDVMCISNNGIRVDYDANLSNAACKLPYEEVSASNRNRKFNKQRTNNFGSGRNTHNSTMGNASNKKLDRQLHNEHRVFMENLHKERQEQLAVETNAVLIIQKILRGFLVRLMLYPDRFNTRNEKKRIVYTEEDILLILNELQTSQEVN